MLTIHKVSYCAIAVVLAGYAQIQHPNLNSTLYVLTSAEYEAATRTVYQSATQSLAAAKADATWTAALEQMQNLNDPTVQEALKPAVVLDIDETVLNNSPFFARLMREDEPIGRGSWDAWVAEHRATALAGVIDYIHEAKRQGIAVVYLTNRACRERADSDAPCPQRLGRMIWFCCAINSRAGMVTRADAERSSAKTTASSKSSATTSATSPPEVGDPEPHLLNVVARSHNTMTNGVQSGSCSPTPCTAPGSTSSATSRKRILSE